MQSLFRRLPNCVLRNHYGSTECHVVTSFTLSGDPECWPSLPPIGRPIDSVLLYILDGEGAPVSDGVTGELHVGGAAVACRYLHDAERSAERFLDDPFSVAHGAHMYRTGDLGRRRVDGELECLGRIDDQVKLRGFRVEPGAHFCS